MVSLVGCHYTIACTCHVSAFGFVAPIWFSWGFECEFGGEHFVYIGFECEGIPVFKQDTQTYKDPQRYLRSHLHEGLVDGHVD